jgi:CelD/BcsL family acetyltransferase involved in cellulose biosynthesis
VNVREIDPEADAAWMAFVEQHPGRCIFHHPAWLRVLRQVYAYRQVCLAAMEGDRIVGIMPLMEIRSWIAGNRAVCLPFSDACGILADHGAALELLVARADELRRQRDWDYVEVRQDTCSGALRTAAAYKVHRVPLSRDADALFGRLKKTQTRQPIARAQSRGLAVVRGTDDRAVRALIQLNARTRRRHGLPPQPDAWFWSIARTMLREGLGFVSTVSVDGRPVAAALFLHWRGTVLYKYSASDAEGRAAHATHAILWDAMRWACEQGFTCFDLGRTDLDNPGLLQFKRGWGGTESDCTYVRMGLVGREPQRDGSNRVRSQLKPLIARTPLPILKLIGRLAYAHVG